MDLSKEIGANKKEKKRFWFRRRQSLLARQQTSQNKNESKFKCLPELEEESLMLPDAEKSNFEGRKKKVEDKDNSMLTPLRDSNNLTDCPLCLTTKNVDSFYLLNTCRHRCCLPCLQKYLTIEITESRVNLSCPECPEKLQPYDVEMILGKDSPLLIQWEEFMLRRMLSVDPDCRWCPAPDCGYAVIAYGCASCPRLSCERPGCNTEFCYHCRQVWHHNQTCDSAHLQRTHLRRMRSNSASLFYGSASLGDDDLKPCPRCGALILKVHDGSCNHMTCTVCDAEFCWLCMQEITDLHYLSPSGCTFWGKKPWSRKKKILWQLGLLVGAPLGIGLVAGIALPVIVFGLPWWAGKKVSAWSKVSKLSKLKRWSLVAGSVLLAAPCAPVLAALAVGVGVPVMLLYVYCVVPFSLCRNGESGLRGQKSKNGGLPIPVGFRLDWAGAGVEQDPPAPPEEQLDVYEQRNHVTAADPSIGEASVSEMTVGSRADHDGASTTAIAGTSIRRSHSAISCEQPSNRAETTSPLSLGTDRSSAQLATTSAQVHVVGSKSGQHGANAEEGKVRKKSLATSSSPSRCNRMCKPPQSTQPEADITVWFVNEQDRLLASDQLDRQTLTNSATSGVML